jgi:DNA-binding PadR family transcriptional regulator
MSPFDRAVLDAIRGLQPHADGVTVHQSLLSSWGWWVSIGAIYVAVERLEQQGCVRSWQEAGGAERGYRPKRCFEVIDGRA